MLKKKLGFVLAIVLVMSLFSGCIASKKETVSIFMPNTTTARWSVDASSLKTEFEKLGYFAEDYFAENDINIQISQIEESIKNGTKALIVTAVETDKLNEVLQKAKEKGIKIIAYDRMIEKTKCLDFYTTFDGFKVGVLQGEHIKNNLGDQKNVLIVSHKISDGNSKLFYDGAMSVLDGETAQYANVVLTKGIVK